MKLTNITRLSIVRHPTIRVIDRRYSSCHRMQPCRPHASINHCASRTRSGHHCMFYVLSIRLCCIPSMLPFCGALLPCSWHILDCCNICINRRWIPSTKRAHNSRVHVRNVGRKALSTSIAFPSYRRLTFCAPYTIVQQVVSQPEVRVFFFQFARCIALFCVDGGAVACMH